MVACRPLHAAPSRATGPVVKKRKRTMNRILRRPHSLVLFAGLLALIGCGSPEQTETVEGIGLANSQIDLAKGADDVDPAAWLALPREELARRCIDVESA